MYRLKCFFYLCLATAVAICFCLGLRITNLSKFTSLEGKHTFYLESPSSQSLIKERLTFADLWKVKGESVILPKTAYEEGMYASNDDLANAIAQKYHAELYCMEEVAGSISYYGYSPYFGEKIILYGISINLHIVLSSNQIALGSPIIFGGF